MNNYLFAELDLRAVIDAQEKSIMQEIDSLSTEQVLNTDMDELCGYFEEKYKIETPKLRESQISVDQKETKVDVSQDRNRSIIDRSEPFYIKATELCYFIPFDGDADLFKCQPSSFTLNPPRGQIRDGDLVLSYSTTEHNADVIKEQFQRELSSIKQYLSSVEGNVASFNSALRDKVRQRLEMRRQKLTADHNLAASLGFPLKMRENSPQTYVVPTVRKKIISIPRPSPSIDPTLLEPTLSMEHYEQILSIITNMVMVMERSPKAFRNMSEEDIRQHFLVQLNGQYEGQATGETFNFSGKTDIIIRHEGKNIFIAECKFWNGPKSLEDAIGQLLDYATWRDTKTAILLFNRGKNLSQILKRIPEIVTSVPNFAGDFTVLSETRFQFQLCHKGDPDRRMACSVLVFEIPK